MILGEFSYIMLTATMKPETILLNVKVILIGSPEIYSLLFNLDEEYRELFKVKADFDNRIERTDDNIRSYAAFVSTKAREERLLPFDASGVSRVVIIPEVSREASSLVKWGMSLGSPPAL